MKFRLARHTNDIEKIQSFYTEVLDFELLGSFKNHNGYDGIFIGKPNLDWHLEFTKSKDFANHTFDEDDALIFYPNSVLEYDTLLKKITDKNILFIISKNPYWNKNGKLFLDPDGYSIIISNLKA